MTLCYTFDAFCVIAPSPPRGRSGLLRLRCVSLVSLRRKMLQEKKAHAFLPGLGPMRVPAAWSPGSAVTGSYAHELFSAVQVTSHLEEQLHHLCSRRHFLLLTLWVSCVLCQLAQKSLSLSFTYLFILYFTRMMLPLILHILGPKVL